MKIKDFVLNETIEGKQTGTYKGHWSIDGRLYRQDNWKLIKN